MSRITPAPEGMLPTDGDYLVNDFAVASYTGIHPRLLSVYRRVGFLPPYDLIFGSAGHGAWRWSTMAEFVLLVRASEYSRITTDAGYTRVGVLRPMVATVWPDRAFVRISPPPAKRKTASQVAA